MLTGKAAHIPTLRAKYKEREGHEWPHGDDYLRDITREAFTVQDALYRMRESDETPRANVPPPS
jgi:hypothetical protein